ncbi:hypothetical protein ACED51_03775 [Photobacterium swingsii]|uniref:hypothetical protein n=1 Tax=Photobacterium swingsii TaxID=680026 RepID=UPI00352CC5BA
MEAVVQLLSLFTLKAAAYHAGDALIFGVAVYLYKVRPFRYFFESPVSNSRAFSPYCLFKVQMLLIAITKSVG